MTIAASCVAESGRHHEVVADLVSRVSETAGATLPEGWDPHDLTLVADGEIGHWSALQRERAVARAAETADAVRRAADVESRARAALDQGRRLVELQRAHADALAAHERLVADQPTQESRIAALGAARRAGAVVPLHDLASRAGRRSSAARERQQRQTAAAAELLGSDVDSLDPDLLDESARHAVQAAARSRALQPREEALAAARQAVHAVPKTKACCRRRAPQSKNNENCGLTRQTRPIRTPAASLRSPSQQRQAKAKSIFRIP